MITQTLIDVCEVWLKQRGPHGRRAMLFAMHDAFCDAGYPNIAWYYFYKGREVVRTCYPIALLLNKRRYKDKDLTTEQQLWLYEHRLDKAYPNKESRL